MVFLFTMPMQVLAQVPPDPFTVVDMPLPPALADWANAYVITYNKLPTYSWGDRGEWVVYMYDKNDITIYAKGDDRVVVGRGKLLKYNCYSTYDDALGEWFITDWYLLIDAPEGYPDLQAVTASNIAWHSEDIYTEEGNIWATANPTPPPPLIGTVQLEKIPEVVGGVAKMIIPVGLVVLLMLLLVALIRYLLRLWTLRIKS